MSNTLQTPESRQSATLSRPTCYILSLHLNSYLKIESAECPGLDDAAARRLTEAAAVWRDERFRLKRIAEACRELNLPTLAIVQTIGKKKKLNFEVPPPLTVPFEPIELNETEPALSGMIESFVSNDDDSETAEVKKARWLGRMFVRVGAPAVMLLPVTINGLVQIITQTATQGFRFWFVAMWLGIFGVMLAACYYSVWRTSAKWMLIPGGVVIRRTFWKNVGTRLERFIPADTMLMLAPYNIGWMATLYRGEKPVHRRLFTRMEATALLAAWQSPIPPKRINEMSDLVR